MQNKTNTNKFYTTNVIKLKFYKRNVFLLMLTC